MGKKKKEEGGIPAWLVTFSDMMTLMLTFFVLLVSMAVVDQQRKLVALGSIIGTFGFGKKTENYLANKDERTVREPGPMNDDKELEKLQPPLWEDMSGDLRFEEDKLTRIVSVPADVLFASGSVQLTAEGRSMVAKLAPIVAGAKNPVLLGGHVSTLRDELGADYDRIQKRAEPPGPAWTMSLHRTLAVYQEFLQNGVPAEQMRVEAFGDARPKTHNLDRQSRRYNRRVDLIIDKTGEPDSQAMQDAMPEPKAKRTMEMDGFVFSLDRQQPDTSTKIPATGSGQ